MAKTIKWFTRSKYNHVGVVFSDLSSIEARRRKGVVFIGALHVDESIDLYKININPLEEKEIRRWLLTQVGKKYDHWTFFQFLFKTATKESRKSSNKWICSELILAGFNRIGIFILNKENIQPWQASPAILSYSPIIQKIQKKN